jgi:hypothetical protein
LEERIMSKGDLTMEKAKEKWVEILAGVFGRA